MGWALGRSAALQAAHGGFDSLPVHRRRRRSRAGHVLGKDGMEVRFLSTALSWPHGERDDRARLRTASWRFDSSWGYQSSCSHRWIRLLGSEPGMDGSTPSGNTIALEVRLDGRRFPKPEAASSSLAEGTAGRVDIDSRRGFIRQL